MVCLLFEFRQLHQTLINKVINFITFFTSLQWCDVVRCASKWCDGAMVRWFDGMFYECYECVCVLLGYHFRPNDYEKGFKNVVIGKMGLQQK